jgi:hypothetical protein
VSAEPVAEARRPAEKPLIHDLRREQRDETHHRINVDAMIGAIRSDDEILEKARRGVPQRNAAGRVTPERVADCEELLVGLNRDVLVIRVVMRQFQSNHRHVEREHGHPEPIERRIGIGSPSLQANALDFLGDAGDYAIRRLFIPQP